MFQFKSASSLACELHLILQMLDQLFEIIAWVEAFEVGIFTHLFGISIARRDRLPQCLHSLASEFIFSFLFVGRQLVATANGGTE